MKPSASAFLYSAFERALEAFKISRWRFPISSPDFLNEALTIHSPRIDLFIHIIIIICEATNVCVKFQCIDIFLDETVRALALNA